LLRKAIYFVSEKVTNAMLSTYQHKNTNAF